MFYPKAECCPFNCDEEIVKKASSPKPNADVCKDIQDSECDISGEKNLLKKIQEVGFAVIDLNLFLDTHPDCQKALELFTKLSATLKSLKSDYNSKYGPLYACENADDTSFKWVAPCNKWPWE